MRPRRDFYAENHPGPGDVLLVVEVVETSSDYDCTTKLPLYARAGIGEVWLIDLPRNTIAIYRQPTRRSYRDTDHVSRGERFSPAAFPRTSFRVNEILG